MKKGKALTGRQEVNLIRRKVRHFTVDKPPAYWLKPSSPLLSVVFGDPARGVPYGKIIELSGMYSGGKTALALELAAEAQEDGAYVAWMDHEACWDDEWAKIRGLNPDKVALFQPEVIETGKKKELKLLSAEQLYEELDEWIKMKFAENKKARFFVGIDSLTAILPEQEEEAGLEGGAMAVQARFFSKMLRKWTGRVWTYNIMFVLVNQVRTNPGVRFGNPEYRPGGRAPDFYSSIIVKVRRPRGKDKKGMILSTRGRDLGIKGYITNQKNKVGGTEGEVIGFKCYWKKRAKFINAEDVE